MSYCGWKLSEPDRARLLGIFIPRYPDVIAHHVTEAVGREEIPRAVEARVIGYTTDDTGLEALIIEIDGYKDRAGGRTYHITWSLDRAANYKPVDSNRVIAEMGFMAVPPVEIDLIPFYNVGGQDFTA